MNLLRYLLVVGFVPVLVPFACSSQDGSAPSATTKEALSSPGTGDGILRSGGEFWENTSIVVPPGLRSECPNGRAFIAGGSAPDVYYADLACIKAGNCTPNAATTSVVPILPHIPASDNLYPTADYADGPGCDNQFVRQKDGSILHVRGGTRVKRGQMFGSIFVWESKNCGTTWTRQGSFDSDMPLDGRCGWPNLDSHLAIYRPGTATTPGPFYFDENNDHVLSTQAGDRQVNFNPFDSQHPPQSGTKLQPVLGVWNANQALSGFFGPGGVPRSGVGLFDNGTWYLDFDGNGQWDPTVDIKASFGIANDIPVVGKWAAPGDNRDLIGVYRDSTTVGVASMFYLDMNGNMVFDGCGTDACVPFGTHGDKPMPWMIGNASARGQGQSVGVYRPSNATFYGDTNGSHGFDGCSGGDTCLTSFASGTSTLPVIGYWPPADGAWPGVPTPQIGAFGGGTWHLDANGNGSWDAGTDHSYSFGLAGDIPLVDYPSFPGTFNRPEAYADPNNQGYLYLTMNCNYNETSETILAWSRDSGATWASSEVFSPPQGIEPLTIATVGGDKLYLFGDDGTSPLLVPALVSSSSNSVNIRAPWHIFANHPATTAAVDSSAYTDRVFSPDGVRWNGVGQYVVPKDGSEGIAPIDRVLTTDRLLTVYPSVRTGTTATESARVVEVKVDWNTSDVRSITTSQVNELISNDATGNMSQATMVAGPAQSRTALMYLKSVAFLSGQDKMYAAWQTLAAASLPFDFGSYSAGSNYSSTTSSGAKRTWVGATGTYSITGDYVKGAGYTDGASPAFFTHWTETPQGGIATRELHTKVVTTSVNGPSWGADNLGGRMIGSPAAASWASGRLDVVIRGTDNALWHIWFDGSWHAWESWGGALSSPPAMTSWGNGRLDIVARRASDAHLMHMYYDASLNPPSAGWGDLIEPFGDGTPAITNWGFGHLDVFGRGANLWHNYCDYNLTCFDDATWESLGVPSGVAIASGIAATAWGPGRVDAFVRGSDGNLWQKWFDGSLGGWQAWANIGRPSAGLGNADPAVTSWGANQLDVYVIGNSDGAIYRRRYNNGWGGWENLGMNRGTAFQAGVAATNWTVKRTDLFAPGVSQELLHAFVQE